MEKYQPSRSHHLTDPRHLPFGMPHHKARKPKENHLALLSARFAPKPLMVAGPIPANTPIPSYSPLPNTPTAADLASTQDAPITPAIQKLADSLNDNPVKIYQWVHNNIQYIPSYGSIQGAALTLESKRGNDFDTASLLIALLRAAKIPARYVYGTVQVPIKQAMNWVGGVTKPEAALQLLSGGGVPNTGIEVAGSIQAVKLEHVWVTAYVDFVPSRGAVNKTPNTWVPMDPSFKQYTFTPGMDLKDKVPFDGKSLLSQIQSSATINNSEGWIQGINGAAIQKAVSDYSTQVQNYVANQNPNATMADISGSQTINVRKSHGLAGTLPYQIVAVGQSFDSVPDNLKHQFRFRLYASASDEQLGSPTISYQATLPALAGKRMTLYLQPATSADAETIASYLPKEPAGTAIPLSDLPTSLPGYLIHMTAVLSVNGTPVAQGGNFLLGQTVIGRSGIYDPAEKTWSDAADANYLAGDAIGIAIDYSGVTKKIVSDQLAPAQAIKSTLASTSGASFDPEALIGSELGATALTYFGMTDGFSAASQRAANVVSYPLPSIGTFGDYLNVHDWLGLPRSVTHGGVVMDIGRRITNVVSKDGGQSSRKHFAQVYGAMSSFFEGFVPSTIYSANRLATNNGVSTITILGKAAANGDLIYTLNSSNAVNILPKLNISNTIKTEITGAIAAGDTITIPANPVTIGSWSGIGYVIQDPATGSSAYKISGGANGGFSDGLEQTLLLIVSKLQFNSLFLGVYHTLTETLANFVGLIIFLIDLFSIGTKCQGKDASNVILAYTFLTVGAIALLAIVTEAAFIPGFIPIILAIFEFYALADFKDYTIESSCRELGYIKTVKDKDREFLYA